MNSFLVQIRFWRYAASLLDLATAAAAFFLSYITVYGDAASVVVPGIREKTLSFTLVFACAYWFFSMHRGSWRYVSIPDLVTILKVSSAAVISFTLLSFLITRGLNFPRSIPPLTLVYLVAGLSFSLTQQTINMPGDGFSFTVRVRCEVNGCALLGSFLQIAHNIGLVGHHLIQGFKIVLNIYP